MSDILLIFPRPSLTSPQKNPAISIFYPGEAAVKNGFEIDYWDQRFDSFNELQEKARQTKIFAISSLSGYMLSQTIEILKWCKSIYPDKPTILGGVHTTFLPENSLLEPFVDYVVLGEGEERLPSLAKAILRDQKGLEEIDGVGYKKNGALIVNPRLKLINLNANYVSPISKRTERYFKMAAERNEVVLPSSRGCPWANLSKACSFCSVRDQYLGSYRAVPFEKWAEDIDKIYQLHPFFHIELEDENSAYFVNHLEKYAAHLRKKGIKFHLHLRADQLQKKEIVRRLAETGCQRIHIGVESGSNRIRNEIYEKNEKNEHFYKAASLLAKYRIEGVYTYMIGAPTETREEIIETLRLSDRIAEFHPREKTRSTIYVLMALPGTKIFDLAKREEWQMPQTMDEWSQVSAASNPKLPNWINNLYLIAGLHHNRYHKTAQNFPGLWRVLILPFEMLCELRWKFSFFNWFAIEKFLIEKLISWRSRKSIGQK